MGICSSEIIPPNPNEIDLSHFELLKVVGKGGFGKVNAISSLATGELLALKRIEKAAVLQSSSHLASVWIERRILSLNSGCPFLLHLIHAFENDVELFLVMPFMQGGDLRYHLKERGTMSENTCRFYAAEMLLGLEALHKNNICYRDLKPENILLDAKGHLRISDFGLAHILNEEENWQTSGQAGTRGYQSPEVLADSYYGTEVDVWSYGVTIYELLHGHRPWKDWARLTSDFLSEDAMSSVQDELEQGNNNELKPNSNGEFHVSTRISPQAQSLLRGLLKVDVSKRLGCGPTKWAEVKQHPFFASIDWEKVANRSINPPITPDTTHANCTADADLADQLLDKKPKPITLEDQKHFKGWKWKTQINPEKAPENKSNNNNQIDSNTTQTNGPSTNNSDQPVQPEKIQLDVK